MSTVLVVDDEPRYRRYLQQGLRRDGHRVEAVAGGREAIDLGARLRPDVLVVDWMLRGDLHGLHVAAALQTVRPDLRSLLITGLPSRDLGEGAVRQYVGRVLEKPFGLADARTAVRELLAGDGAPPRPALGVLELDAGGLVLHASARAGELLGPGTVPGARLDELVTAEPPLGEGATRGWIELRRRDGGAPCLLLAGPPGPGGTRIAALRLGSRGAAVPLAEMLAGSEAGSRERWPHPGRVIVVDDDDLLRRFAVTLLERVGAAVYPAASHAEALRLLEHDPGVSLVIVDYQMPEGSPGPLVQAIQAGHPGVRLVGSSASSRQDEFAAAGVPLFLPKPWRLGDLMDLLGSPSPDGARAAPAR